MHEEHYQTLAVDNDEEEVPLYDYHYNPNQAPSAIRRSSSLSFGTSFSQKLAVAKQRASRALDDLTNPSHQDARAQPQGLSSTGSNSADACRLVSNEVMKIVDPLRINLDLASATTLLDDMRSWAVAVPDVVPAVVDAICSQLRTSDPHVSFLTLELLDFLVKNTGSSFHERVATQPLMSRLARLARGTQHHAFHDKGEPGLPNLASSFDKFASTTMKNLKTAKKYLEAEITGNGFQHHRQCNSERQEFQLQARLASEKALEMVFVWGEGLADRYDSRSTTGSEPYLPLFGLTYQTLINEGVAFDSVEVSTPAMLETPADVVKVGSAEASLLPKAAVVSDATSLAARAHETVKLLSDVLVLQNKTGVQERDECEGGNNDSSNSALINALREQCEEQQQQMAGLIESLLQLGSSGSGDNTGGCSGEDPLIAVISANEALLGILNNLLNDYSQEQGQEQETRMVVDQEDDGKVIALESIEKQRDNTEPSSLELLVEIDGCCCGDLAVDETYHERQATSLLDLDFNFNDQGQFDKGAATATTGARDPEEEAEPSQVTSMSI
jgi:hypothetical protein